MDVGEGVAIPGASASADEEEGKEKKCRFLARAKRPSGAGPWWSGGKLGGSEEDDDLTGHAFCAHEDEAGGRTWYGFYPKGAIVGWRNVPEEDRIAGVLDFFKYVAGELYGGDAEHPYDDEREFVIPRDAYDAGEAFSAEWRAKKTKYCLARQNCTTFVVRDGAAARVAIPSGGWPFSNPASFGKKLAGAR
jgi:hypothetical protein